jgi:hypothetical protein
MTETLNQAIATEKFLVAAERRGCEIPLEHPDGTYEQLKFRR